MKILLINPPTDNILVTNVPKFVDQETGKYPPLGLLYIAAAVLKFTDHQVEVLDACAENLNYSSLKTAIEDKKPDVVGIQTYTFTLIDTLETARIAKEINPGIKVVLGGIHVNIYPVESIIKKNVDFLVLGEGEYIFVNLLNALHRKKDVSKVSGIVYKKDGKIINTGCTPLIEDLDAVPIPARELTKINLYTSVLAKQSPITTMFSSRGCPFQCIFCDRPHLGKLFRARSASNVVDEMQVCSELGIKEIFFYDDTFSVDRQRVLDICNEIRNRALNICWDIRTRVDTVDEGLLDKLREAGCSRIHYGIESGVERISNILRKYIDLQKAKHIMKATHDAGITTLAYFMIGNPTETKKEILETIAYANRLTADFAHFAITVPFPATKLYELGLSHKIFKNDYWREFAADPVAGFIPHAWEEILSRQEISTLLAYAYRSFYLRPDYLIKKVIEIRSLNEFSKKAKAGLKLLFMRMK